jgi:hypothetical protein
MKTYLLLGLVIVAAIAGTLFYVRGGSVPTVNPLHEQRAQERVDQAGARSADADAKTVEIERLRAVADQERQGRIAAEQRAASFAARNQDLAEQVTRIEAERKALTRATSIGQVREALARRGVVAK